MEGLKGWLLLEAARSFPCPMEPMPASSKTEPPLVKVDISDGDSTSGITYFRKGKSCHTTATSAEKGVRIYEINSPADTKVSKEEGRRWSRHQNRFPCS